MFADTITVTVPITFKRRRGRKRIVAPDGTELAPGTPSVGEIDNALVKAIARAYRWQRMLESGEHATLRELAKAERLDPAYVSRVLKLTLLAPMLIEDAINGTKTSALDLRKLTGRFSLDWQEQASLILSPGNCAG
ncbi:hypothetical protein [Acuticoccus kandeliae]|uniref:hypothetical protein n=1 Tax=Acuticoccus kandeliae TaxID=2073160 RepID=UPI000D3E44F2|nr:hypothetical protein [Acuticoccus kandeliae]